VDLLEVQAHIHVEDHETSHDAEVCVEEDETVVYDEVVDTRMLEGFVASTNDEGITSCPTYYDFEDHVTSTHVGDIDGTYVEDVYDDEGLLEPKYDDHSTPYPFYDSYDDEGVMVPTYDGGWVFERPSGDMDPSFQEPCMEDTRVGDELGGENQPKTLCEDDVTHESHHSMVSHSSLGDVDEGNILTNDSLDHLDVIGQNLLAWKDLEDHLLVTEDHIT
jgi:hypothetical protein